MLLLVQDTTGIAEGTSIVSDALEAIGATDAFPQKLLQALVVLVAAWLAYRVLKLLTRRWERGFSADSAIGIDAQEQRVKTMIQLLNSVGAAAIAIATVLTVLNLFVNIAPILAGVGVAGLAISFGAQSLVKDFISGFFILFENQFGVGDAVEINGKSGVVERMTLRMVALRDVEGILHVIPNGAIDIVSNKTRGLSRALIDVGVAYHESIDRVMAVLRALLDEFRRESAWQAIVTQDPRILGVNALGDSAVVVRVVVDTVPGKHQEVRRELLRRIKNRFDAESIEIPFPQRTLHLGGDAAEQLRDRGRR